MVHQALGRNRCSDSLADHPHHLDDALPLSDPRFDAVAHPERLATLPYAADSAGWFWAHGAAVNLNKPADKDDVRTVTRLINGGQNGLRGRREKLLGTKAAIESIGAKRVQQALNAIGSYPTLLVDGDLGPRTTSIIREFQSDFLIRADGVVNAETWSRLKRD